MNLKHIALPPLSLAALFGSGIVEEDDFHFISLTEFQGISYAGNNKKKILWLVEYEAETLIDLRDRLFFLGILNACKLQLSDIALVNLAKQRKDLVPDIPNVLGSEIILICGASLSVLNLPFNIPLLQVQLYNGKKFVCIPSLRELSMGKEMKSKLWLLLKTLFSI